MFKEVKIGEQTIGMISNGATPYRYRNLFHKDLIAKMNDEMKADDVTEMASELAFIMAKSAEKADMNLLNLDDFYEWLEQFEVFDIASASEDIFNVYVGQDITTSTAKKKQSAKQSAK